MKEKISHETPIATTASGIQPQSGIYEAQSSITRKIGNTRYVLTSYSSGDRNKANTMLWHMERLVKNGLLQEKISV